MPSDGSLILPPSVEFFTCLGVGPHTQGAVGAQHKKIYVCCLLLREEGGGGL